MSTAVPDYELLFGSTTTHMALDTVELDAQWASLAQVHCTAGASASGCQATVRGFLAPGRTLGVRPSSTRSA